MKEDEIMDVQRRIKKLEDYRVNKILLILCQILTVFVKFYLF